MIILLYGEDTYRSKNKLKKILEKYQNQAETSLENIDASDVKYRDFNDQARQTSMFANRKLVILRNVFSNKEFRDAFLEEAERWNESEDIILLYEEDKIRKNDVLLKFIKKNAEMERFQPLEGKELKEWANKEFNKYEVKIRSKALSVLLDFVGDDLWKLSNEIQKLANYKKGGEVKVEDVKNMVRPDLETDIFKTVDAFALKNKNKALGLIQEHLDQGDSPLYILHMINYQLRNLLTVKQLKQQGKTSSQIKKKTDLHPYVVKKTLGQSNNFTLEEIKKIYHRLFEVDLNIKTGKIDKEEGLKELIARV